MLSKINNTLTADDSVFKDKILSATDRAIAVLKNELPKYISGDTYPGAYNNGRYLVLKNADLRNHAWTEGFWPGQLWLAYELTGDEAFRKIGEKNVIDFNERMKNNMHIDWHHDTGFLYTPSCVASYKLTGNELARETALRAAYSLSRRFRPRGEFIQSMSYELDTDNYKFIIDTMMNIPLLFWAAEVSGNEHYRDIAIRHAETTRHNIIRSDGSTYHHFMMDFESAGPKGGLTLQGFGDNSCWSRGQAWMIYGSALMYAYTGDDGWIDVFEKVTDYFIAHLPEDFVPHWDFAVLGTDDDDRDTSAGSIAVCGIIEMYYNIGNSRKIPRYIDIAKKMLTSIIDKYSVSAIDGIDGLVTGVMPAKPQGKTQPCASYGDYFYLEALVRAQRIWKRYW